jgi:hypothetical protein
MPDVQEVFRMATQKVRPDPGFADRQQGLQHKRLRDRKLGAFAVVAVIGIAAVAIFLGTRGGERTSTPVDQPSPSFVPLADPEAVGVASNFVGAFSHLDATQAKRLIADGADITGLTETGSTSGDLRREMAWLAATGFKQHYGPCVPSGSSTLGTEVSCSFEFHALRSDEFGRGPFTGSSMDLTIDQGKVVVASWTLNTETFSPRVWEPFAAWVSQHYPGDVDVMYAQPMSLESHTPASIRLWRQHTKEYAQDASPTR